MEANYRRITVAAKNVDTREHDIADSDDYFQYHGGMVATAGADRCSTEGLRRRLDHAGCGPDPLAHRGDCSGVPRPVVNPRWISAMQRHGYKGAFELAATVDYLYGFDATTGVVTDGMYDQLAESYVLDQQNQDFMRHANPWALRGIIEKLHEAADRGLWAEPDPDRMAAMQQVLPRASRAILRTWPVETGPCALPDAAQEFLTERHLPLSARPGGTVSSTWYPSDSPLIRPQ